MDGTGSHPTLLSSRSAHLKHKSSKGIWPTEASDSPVGRTTNGTETQRTLLTSRVPAKALGPWALGTWVNKIEDKHRVRTIDQSAEKNWPLRWKALRVYAMADKTMHGLLDVKELMADGGDTVFLLQCVLGAHAQDGLALSAWLESVKKFAIRDEIKAGLFLDLCLKHVGNQKEHWPLRDEALQVFRMGVRNGDCQLDMKELTEIRHSVEFAQAMMNSIDIDKNGTVSKGEWLAYVKRLADQNEESAAAVLALYRKQLGESSNTAQTYDAAKYALNALVDNTSAGATARWWACY
jgi:hypothetical protein